MRRFRTSGISIDTTDNGSNGIPSPPISSESRNSRSSKGSNGSRGRNLKMRFRRNKSNNDGGVNSASVMRKRTPKGQAKKSNFKFKNPAPASAPAEHSVKCLSPQADMRLQLLPRIAEYKERKWIAELDEQRLMQLLADNPVAFGKQRDKAAIQVKQLLDKIRTDNMSLQISSRSFNQRLEEEEKIQLNSAKRIERVKETNSHTRNGTSEDDANDTDDFKENSSAAQQQQYDHHKDKYSYATAANQEDSATNKLILDPQEAWEDQVIEDGTHMEYLYVEMCFFARLGFIQPPYCLKCVYKECVDGQNSEEQCQRWVAWRKNANTLIHPLQLQDNIVLVRCHTARRLIKGEVIDSHEWDEVQKELLHR
mmetsp:Transcript_20853/g.28980  ORF Transcript_20853/g.28980 Transcript_20853/m.28980 type:complete len:367 (-) Transcript_20853:93-1193(-)